MKPEFEKITPKFGSSVFVEQHLDKKDQGVPFWHFHPELELVYIDKARGKRHIGNHLSYFNNSQLILIGANLPHSGFADGFNSEGRETIVQFREDFLGSNFFDIPESSAIKFLFKKARSGILFGRATKDEIGPKIEKLIHLQGFERILALLEILNDLGSSNDYTLLNVIGYSFEVSSADNQKTTAVYDYVRKNFKEQIYLDQVASLVSMTVPAFCRYFKKNTGKTFTQFINEYRLVHATKLLSESTMSITDVCHESGFNNFSHFNKLFKNYTGKSPLKYRKEVRQLLI
jgi:AraC-like DNA-binding protein